MDFQKWELFSGLPGVLPAESRKVYPFAGILKANLDNKTLLVKSLIFKIRKLEKFHQGAFHRRLR